MNTWLHILVASNVAVSNSVQRFRDLSEGDPGRASPELSPIVDGQVVLESLQERHEGFFLLYLPWQANYTMVVIFHPTICHALSIEERYMAQNEILKKKLTLLYYLSCLLLDGERWNMDVFVSSGGIIQELLSLLDRDR